MISATPRLAGHVIFLLCLSVLCSGCTKYHTRAFCTTPEYERKFIDGFYVYINEFAAYEGMHCGLGSCPDSLLADSLFEIELRMVDTASIDLGERWWENRHARDSVDAIYRERFHAQVQVDSLVLHLIAKATSIALHLDADRPCEPTYRVTSCCFGPVLIPRAVERIDAVLHFSQVNDESALPRNQDSLVFHTYRVEKHRWGLYGGR